MVVEGLLDPRCRPALACPPLRGAYAEGKVQPGQDPTVVDVITVLLLSSTTMS